MALLLAAAPVVSAEESASLPSPEARIEQRLGESVPLDLSFRDETGQQVQLRRYFNGKPVVLVLAYFGCPRLCSVILNGVADGLRKVDYEMGKDYTVLTVSFDPREKPDLASAKKAAYAASYGRPGADVGWHFLTGEAPQIKRLADAVGFGYSFDAKKNEFAHGSGIMILTAEGKISRYFYGIDFPPRDLTYGLEDASAGTIGSPLTRPLRLLCYGYDPLTGRYTMMTMQVVRLAGLVTLLVLGVGLWLFWRRERRRTSSAAVATVEGQGTGGLAGITNSVSGPQYSVLGTTSSPAPLLPPILDPSREQAAPSAGPDQST